MFQHLLREESIRVNFDGNSREAILAELVALLPGWGISPRHKRIILDRLLDQPSETIFFGEEVLFATCTIPGIAFPLASLVVSRSGASFATHSHEYLNFMFLVILPEHEDSESQRLRLIQDVMNFDKESFLKQRLKIAENPEEAYEIILREGQVEIPAAVQYSTV